MNLMKKFRLHWQQKFIRKHRPTNINRDFVNLDQAERIGVLFDAARQEAADEALTFASNLRNAGKKVRSLAHLPSVDKGGPEPEYPHFTNKQISWNLIPSGAEVERFQKSDFDILFCLFLDENPALECLAALSKAKTRVGPVHGNLAYYDLLIDMGPQPSINALTWQAQQLLKKMNVKDDEPITIPV